MTNEDVRVRDPGWSQQLFAIAIGSLVLALAIGAVAGWSFGAASGLVIGALSVGVVARFFDRRILEISGGIIRVTDSSGELVMDVSDLTRIEASQGYHVGQRVDLYSTRGAITDVDPSDAKEFLVAVGAAVRRLHKEEICTKGARPYMGL